MITLQGIYPLNQNTARLSRAVFFYFLMTGLIGDLGTDLFLVNEAG